MIMIHSARRYRLPVALGVVALVSASAILSGCGSSDSGAGSAPSANQSQSLTVWMMDGDLSDASLADISSRFEAQTGVKPDIEIQQWDNINTKLATALSQNNPPDVVDIGNTDVPLFAASGALADLTSQKSALDGGQDWLPGLAGPATFGDKLYAAPLFAGNRVIIYNKKIWAAAGITSTPTTWTEFTHDLDLIKAKNPAPTFSALYLPGEDWQTNLQFLFDAGGQIATQDGDTWAVQLSTAAAQKGFTQWKEFQNKYSTASSRTATAYVPDPNAIFGKGQASAISNVNVEPPTLEQSYPDLKGQLGTFPWPSQNNPGQLMPVFLGGSDVAIASKSPNQDLALKFIALVTSDDVQTKDVVGIDGWTPISTQLIDKVTPSLTDIQKPFFEAAKNSVPTPSAPGWATVESNLYMENFFGTVTSGSQSIPDATSGYDTKIAAALNAQQ